MSVNQPIAAIVLAAGFSRRFGIKNKLLAVIDGMTVLERTLSQIETTTFGRRLVVTPFADQTINQLVTKCGYECSANEDRKEGIGSSIACGSRFLSKQHKPFGGIAFFLGDMPFISKGSIEQLVEQFRTLEESHIVRPHYLGTPGHPVIFPAMYLKELVRLSGDSGASSIIKNNRDKLSSVDVDDAGVIRDIDLPSDLI